MGLSEERIEKLEGLCTLSEQDPENRTVTMGKVS